MGNCRGKDNSSRNKTVSCTDEGLMNVGTQTDNELYNQA